MLFNCKTQERSRASIRSGVSLGGEGLTNIVSRVSFWFSECLLQRLTGWACFVAIFHFAVSCFFLHLLMVKRALALSIYASVGILVRGCTSKKCLDSNVQLRESVSMTYISFDRATIVLPVVLSENQ